MSEIMKKMPRAKRLFSPKRFAIKNTLKILCSCSIPVQIDEFGKEELWTLEEYNQIFGERYRKLLNRGKNQ